MKTSIDILPSKNYALRKYSTHVSSLNTVNTLNSHIRVFIKSCEKEFITKERIVSHALLKIMFKWALHYKSNNTLQQRYKITATL